MLTPPEWDLSDLYSSPDDPKISADLNCLSEAVLRFSDEYRGRISRLDPVSLSVAISESEVIRQLAARIVSFASLRFAASMSPDNGAFQQRILEAHTSALQPAIFFEVELSLLGAQRLLALSEDAALHPYRHYLQSAATRAAHSLSEAEEKIAADLANTGRRSFNRLFSEISSGLRIDIPSAGETVNLSEALDLQHSADRHVRRESAEQISKALEGQGRTIAFIFNTLVQDKATMDRLRGYSYPDESQHIANELTRETVDTFIGVATEAFPLVAKFYNIKRRLLGLPSLTHYDRYAPLPTSGTVTDIEFAEARQVILHAFCQFDHATYAAAAEHFFDNRWIDAVVRPDKRGGAFCSFVTPDCHPYILVNYLGKPSDVRTLAHELGHGIHSYLAREQTLLNYHGTLPMAEVASTFAEMLVFEAQVRDADDASRLDAYCRQIEQGIGTIFRQAALYRFEQSVHQSRRTTGELSVERLGELFQEHVGAMFGDSLTLEQGHAIWWSYISHFMGTPFYVYAYSFGEMLALALFQRYRQEGEAFTVRYLNLLRSGGSLSPAELVAPMGVDLTDRSFWRGAIAVFATEVATFDRLARSVHPDKFAD